MKATPNTYLKSFASKDAAYGWMVMKNRTNRVKHLIYCLVDGPDGDYVVCDLDTAIDIGMPYEWHF